MENFSFIFLHVLLSDFLEIRLAVIHAISDVEERKAEVVFEAEISKVSNVPAKLIVP